MAAGEPKSVQLPDEFAYHGLLNAWTSTTFHMNSSKLREAVAAAWNHSNSNYMVSVAPHIILNEEMQPVKANKKNQSMRYKSLPLEVLVHEHRPKAIQDLLENDPAFNLEMKRFEESSGSDAEL